jgi:hypothetical protein
MVPSPWYWPCHFKTGETSFFNMLFVANFFGKKIFSRAQFGPIFGQYWAIFCIFYIWSHCLPATLEKRMKTKGGKK